MPPANTPQITPPRSETPSTRPLTPPPYRPLMPHILSAQARQNEDVEMSNAPYLRVPLDSPSRSSSSTRPPVDHARRQRLLRDMDRMNRMASNRTRTETPPEPEPEPEPAAQDEPVVDEDDQRQRLQRVLARLRSHHDSAASYGDRVPAPRQQSLYDWAPRQQANGEDDNREDDEGLEEILGALRRQHPSTHSDILESLGRRQLHRQRESEAEARTTWRSQQPRTEASSGERRNESLRSAAIMQHARTSVRSPSGTERMLRYLRNRERTGQRTEAEREDTEDADPLPTRSSVYAGGNPGLGSRYESNRLAWQTQQPSFQNARNTDGETRRENDTRARIEAYRRGYLADNPAADRTSPTSPLSPFLENAVKYLDRLRACPSYEDSLSAAIDHGLALKDFFAENHEDFITSTHHCPAPAYSSLLQPGAVFEGTQNTAASRDSEAANARSMGLGSSIYTHEQPRAFDATRPWLSHNTISPAMLASNGNDISSNSHKAFQDRWPVKVIIQAVDYEKMTMAGVMEAYDVPTTPLSITSILSSSSLNRYSQSALAFPMDLTYQYSAPAKRAFPITTYLEGQIIDFHTHSFLTPNAIHNPVATSQTDGAQSASVHGIQTSDISFPPTSAVTDAANWRNLPPFNAMNSDEEVARTLLSRTSMDEIMSEWVFMRWKERCFIHSKSDICQRHEHTSSGTMPLGEGDDTDTGHGLTISGFYYVSLRRSDGKIEGLYFDTKTSPYQHLKLESKRSGLHGAWKFK